MKIIRAKRRIRIRAVTRAVTRAVASTVARATKIVVVVVRAMIVMIVIAAAPKVGKIIVTPSLRKATTIKNPMKEYIRDVYWILVSNNNTS